MDTERTRETPDALWPDGPRFFAAPGVFPLGTDSVLLADFAAVSGVKRILDLGCGGGVLAVLLALRVPEAFVEGVDVSPEAAALCRRNLAENGAEARSRVIEGDLREHRTLLRAGDYDLALANPPYFPAGSGYAAPDPQRAAAREERSCRLEDVLAAARYALRWGGRFALVHRPERLSEVLCAMTAAGIEPKRLRLVQPRTGAAPNLFLVEGRRGGRPGLELLPPLLLAEPDGTDSAEVKRIYHRR